MAATSGAKTLPDDKPSTSVSAQVALSAAEAVKRLQKAAETIAADAEKLQESTERSASKTSVERLRSFIAPRLTFVRGNWGKAAAASVTCLAIAAAAVLGLRDGAHPEKSRIAALDIGLPWKASAEDVRKAQEMRDQIRDLAQEVHSLRAQMQKQAEDTRAAQARATAATAAAAATGQATARFDKIEHDTTARLDRIEKDTSTKLDQHATRIERVERLVADPVVTSSIPKSPTNPPAPIARAMGTPGGDAYVLRGVHNGVATVQTRRGLIEVAPGDMIPGVGRVKSIEKVEGHWVVVTRDGVIDAD